MRPNKQWDVYVIHHSHTDIGYTERQDKIIRYHCDYIRQAVDILNDLHRNNRQEYQGFVWQCENYWQVKNFYAHAPQEYREDFENYVRSGEIGLSGNYLNMTELISSDVLDTRLEQARQYGEQIGHPVISAMTADVNGYAWGYADALYRHGIRHLFSCVHPHHGMFPLYRKNIPFYWEGPGGNRVLVWNGEHYHYGNELFLAPRGGNSYLTYDEFHRPFQEGDLPGPQAEEIEKEELHVAFCRIERYLANLEEEGYPYDLVPVMVSGVVTDNAPPSAEIARRLRQLNDHYRGQIRFRMVTLEQFFEQVEQRCRDLPVYSGDWNDWWADGVGSTPAAVKVFCDARRKYDLCRKLDPRGELGKKALLDQAEEDLMLYAEHTWGHSASVAEPWETMVTDLEMKKTAYAVNANTAISLNLDEILAQKGEISILYGKPQKYRLINPHGMKRKTTVLLPVEGWEYLDGVRYNPAVPIQVTECETGNVLKSQVQRAPRGTLVEVLVELEAGEEKTVEIHRASPAPYVVKNHAHIGAEGVEDLLMPEGFRKDTGCVETDYYRITFDQKKGIAAILDKKDGKQLLMEQAPYPAFSGIYEVTDQNGDAGEIRRSMGRNRKSTATRRFGAVLENLQIKEKGDVYIGVQLDYNLEGTGLYSVLLKIYKDLPKLQATVRMHKSSRWDPENLYVSLPFTAGEEEVRYLDKTGCIIRPGIDQLPGSNMEFYLLQNGVVLEGRDKTVTVAVRDTPLVTFGSLEAKPIRLCDGNNRERNGSEIYSWVMNNFWETNFKVDLGGFYEFSYVISTWEKMDKEDAVKVCEAENEGILGFYTR